MLKSKRRKAELLVEVINEALGKSPALTEKQIEDIEQLRAQVLELCQAGELDKAKRCQELALMTIRNGAPVPE